MALSHPFAFKDDNVRVGFGMDPDEKLNKVNCLQPSKKKYNGLMEYWNDGFIQSSTYPFIQIQYKNQF